jgi:RNA polymerase sigma-70 factor (ECF subfamily)
MANIFNTDLVFRAQKGSAEAIGELFELYHQPIFRYLYYRTSDPNTAEDLTGDVFLRMVRALPGYRIQNLPFQAWLFQIARNVAIDHYRKNSNHPEVEFHENIPAAAGDPDTVLELTLTSEILKQALIRLNEDQRDVILLRFVEQMPIALVAQTLHKSEDAVKGLQRRALMALKEYLEFKEHNHA